MSSGRKPAVGLLDRARCNSFVLATALRWFAACWVCGAVALPVAFGQEDSDPVEESVFFPSDRDSMRKLAKARELLAERRYDDAVQLLDTLLEAPEDYFFQPRPGIKIHRSIKTEAQRLIGELPASGRSSYQLQFGAEAKQLLETAAREGDADGLAEVSRRFFHTKAGYEATELLGTYHMEQGRPLAAALCFKRLQDSPAAADAFEPVLSIKIAVCWRRAGMPAQAQKTLARLKRRFPNAEVTIAGRNRKLFQSDAEALNWLAQAAGPPSTRAMANTDEWAMYRGDPSRNAPSQGGSPLLNRRWAVPLTNDPQLDKGIEQLEQAYIDQARAVMPAWHPLVVKDIVFMRSLASLVAVDFKTGKRLWKGPTDEAIRQVLDSPKGDAVLGDSSMLSLWLEQRVWQDATYGTMSSDGESVFCVEDVGFGLSTENQRTVFLPNGRMVVPTGNIRSYNRLAAYEIATEGKLKWELPGDTEDKTGLAGAFFLGPPLPLAEHLYVLAEIKGEIRLLALNARTGAQQWSQQLAVLEQSIFDDSARRTAGVSPSYADGVLVCPTAAGAVVAVDLTTRSLLWGYQYHATPNPATRPRMRGFAIVAPAASNEGDQWADGSLTVADGRVLLAPREKIEASNAHAELHCLNLLDGSLLWKAPREDGLYVGCVADGKVLIVGRSNLRCYKLADGSDAWPEDSAGLPAGAAASGRGFFSAGNYFLPLTTAEVLAVDVQTGKVVSRSRSRSGTMSGNLICYHGAVISQSSHELECFYQLDDLRRQVATALEKNAADPSALALRGELLLDENKLDEAVDVLRRSFRLEPETRTRELLVDALLQGLRSNFAAQRKNTGELEKLIDQPAQRLVYLRQLASGLQQVGEVLPAFHTYLDIIALKPRGDGLEMLDGALSARRDRWVQARLKNLWQTASAANRDTIEKAAHARLEEAAQSGPDALRAFLRYFGSYPVADEARERLLASLPAETPLLEREQLLRKLENSPSPARARAAVAQLARLLSDAGREDDASIYYAQLAGPWADLVCLDGKTGRELVAALPASEIRTSSLNEVAWPTGLVKKEALKNQPSSYRSFAVELRGPKGPFFTRSTIELDQPRQALVGRDGLGRESWRVSLVERNDHNQYGFNPNLSHGRVDGHLLLLSMGFQVLAIDTLGIPGKDGPRVLWRQDLTDVLAGRPGQMGIHGQPVNLLWGGPQRHVAADAHNRQVGNTGPLTDELACFQRQRSLVAVDPLTGETLWTRGGIQPGSDVFGDDERLFVTTRGSSEAIVLRTLDGEELGRRKVPPPEQRLAAIGNRVVTWSTVVDKSQLQMRDVWTEKDIWQQSFESGARPWPIDDEAVGVLDRQGRFVVLSLSDGSTQIDGKVPAEPTLSEVFVFRTPTHDLLVTNRPAKNVDGDNVQPVPGGFGNPVINGMVHGFDRQTGQLIYSTPVENRSLTFNQPADLPVLVFASQIYRSSALRNNSGESALPRAAVLCIDKRTGRVVYNEQSAGPITTVELQGDPDQHQMTLKTIRAAVRLTFTDQPWPPPSAAAKSEPKGSLPSRAGRAVARGVQKWFEALTPPPVQNQIPPAKKDPPAENKK